MNLFMKKTYLGLLSLVCLVLAFSTNAFAISTLQVGAPGGTGEGTYADYLDYLTGPVEEDTAVTSGSVLYAAGAYKYGDALIGGQYGSFGTNWSDLGFDSSFDTAGAVLMATVSDGTLGGGTLTINGITAFYSTVSYEDGFTVPDPPANHNPIKDQDYMFFDIGDFAKSDDVAVPNFDEESGFEALGEIKELIIATSGYEWIHFDLFALVTDTTGDDIVLKGNPGSHDVTWKELQPIPEPGTLLLLGSGLIGFVYNRKKLVG